MLHLPPSLNPWLSSNSTMHSEDGRTWRRFDRQMEVSGYHHNVRGGFMMLRPGIYAAGSGAARFRNFQYRAL